MGEKNNGIPWVSADPLDPQRKDLRTPNQLYNLEAAAYFSRANSIAMTGDQTLVPMKWRGAADLSTLAGKPVRFRFYLTKGSLYSFWVSSGTHGAATATSARANRATLASSTRSGPQLCETEDSHRPADPLR